MHHFLERSLQSFVPFLISTDPNQQFYPKFQNHAKKELPPQTVCTAAVQQQTITVHDGTGYLLVNAQWLRVYFCYIIKLFQYSAYYVQARLVVPMRQACRHSQHKNEDEGNSFDIS